MSQLADAVSPGFYGVHKNGADIHGASVYIFIVKRTVDQAFAQFRVFVLAGTDGGDYYNQAIQ